MQILYWSTTAIISTYLLLSSYTYVFSESTIAGVRELGFPDFFRVELAVLKVIAAILLLLPQVPLQLKEWAYAGVGLFLITAFVAHAAHKDPILINAVNVLLFGVLVVSNVMMRKVGG